MSEPRQGEQGESSLVSRAEAMTAYLVKAALWHKRWIAVLVTTVIVLAGVVGYLVYRDLTHPLSNQLRAQVAQNQQTINGLRQYVQVYAQHSCTALDLLTAAPVTQPSDPAANPSREENFKIYQALMVWRTEDHCE